MKNLFSVLFVTLILISSSNGQIPGGGGHDNPDLKTNVSIMQQWQIGRFGMFVHWGPVSLRGTEIGWSRGREVEEEEYDNLYKEFDPVLFDADQWIKVVKDAGMKYFVITARHHDGFCLWDSKFTDYDIGSTPYKKDVISQLREACEKQDIQFGLYYSICDWWHKDYPLGSPGGRKEKKEHDMPAFFEYMKDQTAELISNYDPEIIWLDGAWENPWTHEMGMEFYKHLRDQKNDLIINDRVDKGRRKMYDNMVLNGFAGDFETPEQHVGSFNRFFPWETCMTICGQWAWKANDKMKSKKECIQTLVKTAGGNGNLLFNVGPMPDGRIEQRQIDRLKEMGNWLKINGESIYGTKGGPYMPSGEIYSTCKNNKIYLHILNSPSPIYTSITLPLLPGKKITGCHSMKGEKLDCKIDKEGVTIQLPNTINDEIDTIIVIELNGSAEDIISIEIN